MDLEQLEAGFQASLGGGSALDALEANYQSQLGQAQTPSLLSDPHEERACSASFGKAVTPVVQAVVDICALLALIRCVIKLGKLCCRGFSIFSHCMAH